jgi:hypothetical protein
MQQIQLNHFLAVVEDTYLLTSKFSGLSLISQLIKYSDSLIIEIDENLLLLPLEKSGLYLEFVKKKITAMDFDPVLRETQIQTYLDKYNTTTNQIEAFRDNSTKLLGLLSDYYKDYETYEERQEAYDCQRKFVDYYTTICVQKILNYCDNKSTGSFKAYNYDKSIFTSLSAFQWFENVLNEEGLLNTDGVRRGFQGLAKAIFINPDCKKHIFKNNVQLKKYIEFLNETYTSEISSKKDLSKADNYIINVSKYISDFLKSNN